jgi:AcrR family transcriptional regulator
MRRRVLEATLDCLVEVGYAALSTPLVARRAGVSRGAQLHHFPTRAELVAQAVEHLYAELRDAFDGGFAKLRALPGVDPVAAAVDLLWSIYRTPRFAAVVELRVAARTDAELRARLAAVSLRHGALVQERARTLFGARASAPARFANTFRLITTAMSGMVLDTFDGEPDADHAALLELLKSLAARSLEP